MSIAIIANPKAGRGRGAKTAQLAQEILAEKNVDFELIYTQHEQHAIVLGRRAANEHETVVALGGDGTIREVLEGIWDTSSTLGIIPAGTGNDYSRGLRIPRQTKSAVDVLLRGYTIDFDIGLGSNRIFGVLTSIGFPVNVIEHVNAKRDGWLKGKPAFLAAVAATLKNLESFPAKINIDGEIITKDIVGLFIMNMPFGGGGMQFTPNAFYGDGLFNILLIDNVTGWELTKTLPKVYTGKHINHPAVTILTGKHVRVECDNQPIMLDGDIFPAQTINTKILHKATKVIIEKPPAV